VPSTSREASSPSTKKTPLSLATSSGGGPATSGVGDEPEDVSTTGVLVVASAAVVEDTVVGAAEVVEVADDVGGPDCGVDAGSPGPHADTNKAMARARKRRGLTSHMMTGYPPRSRPLLRRADHGSALEDVRDVV
jgi:hypothetical protein